MVRALLAPEPHQSVAAAGHAGLVAGARRSWLAGAPDRTDCVPWIAGWGIPDQSTGGPAACRLGKLDGSEPGAPLHARHHPGDGAGHDRDFSWVGLARSREPAGPLPRAAQRNSDH